MRILQPTAIAPDNLSATLALALGAGFAILGLGLGALANTGFLGMAPCGTFGLDCFYRSRVTVPD